ncbi:DUF805 domain-containing protein [Gymnodinialimonas ulvae]|uniref:DUF805 domain-containing protein n=1 Tax=Gymnodinialimonas ulvae TaxID=3126504 RepID=UPI00309747E4
MTNWYYAEDDERRGPVEEVEIQRLIATGQIADDTLVWRDGLEGWENAAQHFAFGSSAVPPPAASGPPPPPAPPRVGTAQADRAPTDQIGPDGLYIGAPSRSFGEAIRVCFSKYVTFSGRASRSEYWFFVLFLVLAGIGATIIDAILFPGSLTSETGGPFNAVLSLATLLPSLAVSWRRLHDTDRSGWWIGGYLIATLVVALFLGATLAGGVVETTFVFFGLMGIVAIGYIILLLVYFCQRGTPGPNRFG